MQLNKLENLKDIKSITGYNTYYFLYEDNTYDEHILDIDTIYLIEKFLKIKKFLKSEDTTILYELIKLVAISYFKVGQENPTGHKNNL